MLIQKDFAKLFIILFSLIIPATILAQDNIKLVCPDPNVSQQLPDSNNLIKWKYQEGYPNTFDSAINANYKLQSAKLIYGINLTNIFSCSYTYKTNDNTDYFVRIKATLQQNDKKFVMVNSSTNATECDITPPNYANCIVEIMKK